MKPRTWSLGMLAASVLALGTPAADPEPPVRVYTNADLAGLPPVPMPSQPIAGLEWVDLNGFLEREYARIDADRRHDLERRDSDRQDRLVDIEAADERYYLPTDAYWPYWGGYGYGYGNGGWQHGHGGSGGNRPGKVHPGELPDRPRRWNDLAGGKPAGGGQQHGGGQHGGARHGGHRAPRR